MRVAPLIIVFTCIMPTAWTSLAKDAAFAPSQATTLSKQKPDASYGGKNTVDLGKGNIGLVRWDLTQLKSTTALSNTALRIDFRTTYHGPQFNLYLHATPTSLAGWKAGDATDAPQDGASCWNHLHYSEVKHVKTGKPLHKAWPTHPQASTKGAPLAKAIITGGMKSITLPIPAALTNRWIKDSSKNAGVIFTADAPISLKSKSITLSAYATDVAAPGTVFLNYSLDKDSHVSINIRNSKGHVIRELLHGAKRKAGKHKEPWDGKDEQGSPVTKGTYTWKLLSSQGLSAEYIMTTGISIHHYEKWPGNHIPTIGVAVDDTGVYTAAGCSEAPGMTIKMTPEGKRIWTMEEFWFDHAAWQGGHSIAVDGDLIYLLQEDYRIQVMSSVFGWSKHTGHKDRYKPRAQWDIAPDPKHKPKLDPKEGGWKAMKAGYGRRTAPLDMDARGGAIVVTFEKLNLVSWIDPKSPRKRDGFPTTGKHLFQVSVPEPMSVAIDDQGHALVISKGQLIKVTKGSNKTDTIIPASKLKNPFRVALHPNTGDIYIAERKGSHQIKQFSAKGELKKTYGKRGGRPEQGRYDGAIGFLNVSDLAIAKDGSFWITEAYNAPRRLAHFSAQGKLINEWYGSQMYANRAVADPKDPSNIWMDSQWGEIMHAKVDLKSRTWKVHATYNYMYDLQDIYKHEGGQFFVRHKGDKTFLVKENAVNVLKVEEAKRRLLPVTKSGNAYYPGGGAGWKIPEHLRPRPQDWDVAAARKKSPSDARSHQPWRYIWHDTNNDGIPHQDEMVFDEILQRWPKTSYVGLDMTYYTHSLQSWKVNGKWFSKDTIQRPQLMTPSFTRLGHPKYDFDQFTKVFEQAPGLKDAIGVWPDKAGNVFTAYKKGQIGKWNKDGKFLFSIGRHAERGKQKPGESHLLYRINGVVNGCIAVNEIYDSYINVWDQDGLWVGRLLDNPVINSNIPKEAYQLCGENFGGSLFEDNGNVYLLGGAGNSTPIYRIDGWNDFKRQQGNVTIK